MKQALIICGMQKDYLPGGVLGHSEGEAIIPLLAKLARSNGIDLTIVCRELHPGNHFSFSQEPHHCVQGTEGAVIDPRIRKLADYTVTMGTRPGAPDDFSAFAAGTLRPVESTEEILRRHGIQAVLVGGLFLDGVVGQTAFDSNALGFETWVSIETTLARPNMSNLAELKRAGVYIF